MDILTQAIVIAVSLIVIGAVVLIVLAVSKPDSFRVERSASMKALPDKIFGLLNDFHNWPSWSPWEKLDPAMTRTHSGAPSGKGAIYEWEGNKKVGKGRMEIMETTPAAKVTIKLDFLKPFEAHHTAEFTLASQGDSTNVTWAMHGRQPFLFKVMTIFFSMDKAVGKDFEAGLANLKGLAER